MAFFFFFEQNLEVIPIDFHCPFKKNNHLNLFDLEFLFFLSMTFPIAQYFMLYYILYQTIELYSKKDYDALG